jgi:twinkle protein
LHCLQGSAFVLVVEGELDKLAVEEATGTTAVLSVPAGASAPSSSAAPYQQQHQHVFSTPCSSSSSSGRSPSSGDKKYAYVQSALPLLQHCCMITIGVDADDAGWHTAQQLAERLGRQRCYYLAWPAAGPVGANALQRVAAEAAKEGLYMDVAAGLTCKDANDLLMRYNKRVLALYVKHAPVRFPLH